MYSPINEDPEWGGVKSLKDPTYEFAEAIVRRGFVRKVLALLCVQLSITAVTATAFVTSQPVKTWFADNPWTLWSSLAVSFILVLILACSEQARRAHPTNLILLFTFTACESLLVGSACASYDAEVVAIAVLLTAAVVAGMALFTFQTAMDLTSMGGLLFSLTWTLLVAGVLQVFFHAPWLHIAICAGGAALFSVYLIFDLQLIMGNEELALSPDEYVLATLNLYLDIINIFLYILQLVNALTKSRE
jgi:FtsH-binding integral membrane protein